MITTDACRTIGYAGDQYRGCFTFTASCRRHHHRHHRPLQDDLKSCMTVKTLSSTLFMFFATFASTVALGVVIKRVTVCPDLGSNVVADNHQNILRAGWWRDRLVSWHWVDRRRNRDRLRRPWQRAWFDARDAGIGA